MTALKVIELDDKTESAWRCKALSSSIEVFRRVRSLDFGTPDRVETSFSSGPHYYLEVLLTDRVLACSTDSRVEAADLAGINTTAKTLRLKTGDVVSCSITDRIPTREEQEFIQNERLIESNNAIAAGLNTLSKKRGKQQQQEPSPAPEINETILWHVQQKILDQLDTKLKSAPPASLVFTLYCRDRITLATMSRRHGWPYRTLKQRKAGLESFLRKNYDLTLASFFVDRSIFGAAERQLQDHRAKHSSARTLAD